MKTIFRHIIIKMMKILNKKTKKTKEETKERQHITYS
jgi:hypothetical protein